MRHHESALRPGYPAPLAHPYYSSARADQRQRFREEIAAFIDSQAERRERAKSLNILPSVLS